MYPAPFKRSDPSGADPPAIIDKNKLRCENWTLGASPMFYETINQTNFGKTGGAGPDRKAQKDAIYALKAKVAGSSIKNEPPNDDSLGPVWQTNSQTVHKPLADAGHIDQSARNEQRKKLTQTNFGLGLARNAYYTTNKLQYAPKTGHYFSQTQRMEKANINSKTNFIADTGDGAFESPPKRFDYGK